jgi:hypothetical protein
VPGVRLPGYGSWIRYCACQISKAHRDRAEGPSTPPDTRKRCGKPDCRSDQSDLSNELGVHGDATIEVSINITCSRVSLGIPGCMQSKLVVFACRDYKTGVAMLDRGLSVNPSLALGWRCRGWMSVLLGERQDAVDQLALALRLSPIDPLNFMAERGMAVALLSLEKYEEAASWAVKALAHRPGEAGALRTAAAAIALAGRIDEARSITADLLQLHPHMRLSDLGKVVGLGRKEDVDRLFRGLRLAGMPE